MTTPELITNEIVDKACCAYEDKLNAENCDFDAMRAAILAIQDDIMRPVYALLNRWKQDAQAYERALREIREMYNSEMQRDTANMALKGDYHKTDFTEFCENNPIKE